MTPFIVIEVLPCDSLVHVVHFCALRRPHFASFWFTYPVSFHVLATLSCIGSVKQVCVSRSQDSWVEAGGGRIEMKA